MEIDDEKQRLYGKETITYNNLSPHPLSYVWIQLDQNVVHPELRHLQNDDQLSERSTLTQANMMTDTTFDGGFKIEYVKDATGKALKYTINKTMMRVDLPAPLAAKTGKLTLQIGWCSRSTTARTPLSADSR